MSLQEILKCQNFAKDDQKDVSILSCEESVEYQFRVFLKGMRMERYFEQFKESECCDLDSVRYFDNDTLENDIGIINKIHRKKILAKCKEMAQDMDAFKHNHGIPSILYNRLAKYGIMTLDILCNEIKNKQDLMRKYGIENDNQREMLWQLIQQNENMVQIEGV